jgi:hypothetical protein
MKRTLAFSWLSMLMPAANATDPTGLPQPLADRVAAARQACAGLNHGEFALAWGAVSRTDPDGDDRPEWVVDESAFSCSTAFSLFCGTEWSPGDLTPASGLVNSGHRPCHYRSIAMWCETVVESRPYNRGLGE